MKLSIVIPAYNEEKTILEIIQRAKAVSLPIEREIIVIDNNSSDETFTRASSEAGVKVFLELTKGKGAAVKRGFLEATGDIFLIQDADLEYDPKDYPAVITPILSGKWDIANGVRMENNFREGINFPTKIFAWCGNQAITLLTNMLYLHDAAEYEGCYKAFTKEVIRSIHVSTDDFDFDNELMCKALKKKYRIADVPIHYNPRGYYEGKHINWRHGFKILWTIVKYRFID